MDPTEPTVTALPAPRARRRLAFLILLLAAAVRLPSVFAAYPYMAYVDEGNYLYPAHALYLDGGWDPRTYLYPSLPVYAAVLSFHAAAAVCRLQGDRLEVAPHASPYYDHFEPPEFLVAARIACLLASLALVWLTMRLGARLGGELAGLLSGLLAALLPALVIRGGIANVDVWAALFTTAALLAAENACAKATLFGGVPKPETHDLRWSVIAGGVAKPETHRWRWAAIAGAAAGLAVDSKYQTGLVVLALVPVLLAGRDTSRQRLVRLAAAATGGAVALVAAMPAWITHPSAVLAAIATQRGYYRDLTAPANYWQQAVQRAEWDQPLEAPELGLPFLLLAGIGLHLLLREQTRVATAIGWLVYGAATLAILGAHQYQPFRSLLPLVPLACVAAGIGLVYVVNKLRSWGRLAPVTAGVAIVLALAGPAASSYARERVRKTDSRVESIRWLRTNAGAEDSSILWRELAFLPGQLQKLPGARVVGSARARNVAKATARFLVAGKLAGTMPSREHDPALRLRARFGTEPTPTIPGWWHGNDQVIAIYEIVTTGN